MSHPNPSHDRSNEYPSDHYKPSGKVKKAKHAPFIEKLGKMASRLKGLQETKHFGASRRARHKMHQRIAKGEDIF